MTINKSQAQSFAMIGIFLPNPVFNHGQLYTAYSRCKDLTKVFLHIEQGSDQGQIPQSSDHNFYTRNVVFQEIFPFFNIFPTVPPSIEPTTSIINLNLAPPPIAILPNTSLFGHIENYGYLSIIDSPPIDPKALCTIL